jgi:predicted DNA-binding transcriptional regulator YafY
MTDNAAQRALRTMDLIPYILENPGVSTSHLAMKFSVTQKQIERDLQLIFLCGLPGYTPYELIDLTFEDGIVSIIEPQVLTKPRNFSSNEMVVIKIGLEILREVNVDEPAKLDKIDTLLQKINKNLDQEAVVLANPIISSPYYSVINSAISQRRQIKIEYQSVSTDQFSTRVITPYAINVLNGNMYLSAYDVDRQAERVFKIDLISKCEIGEQTDMDIIKTAQNELMVELMVDEKSTRFIERNTSIVTKKELTAEGFKVVLKVSNLDWICRAILSFAPHIRVISPPSLSKLVDERIKDLQESYSITRKIGVS